MATTENLASTPPLPETNLQHPHWDMLMQTHVPDYLTNTKPRVFRALHFTTEQPIQLQPDEVYEEIPLSTILPLLKEEKLDFGSDDLTAEVWTSEQAAHRLSEMPLRMNSPRLDLARRVKWRVNNEYCDRHQLIDWWDRVDLLDEYFEGGRSPFGTTEPTEQLIAGQDGRGIRLYNYGPPMTEEQQEAFRLFVDKATQFFGDKVYEVLSDVVIADVAEEHRKNMLGFVLKELPHVFFLDERILTDYSMGSITNTMAHELGHLLHGLSKPDEARLLKFAEAVGWDTAGLVKAIGDKDISDVDVKAFGPAAAVVTVRKKNPEKGNRTMSRKRFNKKPEAVRNRIVGIEGLFTDYSYKNPQETSAETTEVFVAHDTQTMATFNPTVRDAWLDHMADIAGPDRPLATPLDRAPVVLDHRTGKDILYPLKPVPRRIYVKLVDDISTETRIEESTS